MQHRPIRAILRRACLLLLAAVASACDSGPQVETLIRPGFLNFAGQEREPEVISGPARVGRPIEVRFVTWGSSSCEYPHSDEVDVDGLDAVVTTLDKTYLRPCILTLDTLPHLARVTFDEPGEARITIRGWRGLGGLEGEDYEQTLTVTVSE